MNELLLRRKSLMTLGGSTFPQGFEADARADDNRIYYFSEGDTIAEGLCVSAYYPVEEGDVIRLRIGEHFRSDQTWGYLKVQGYISDEASYAQWNMFARGDYPSYATEITIPSGTHYIRTTMVMQDIDDGYIYNVTKSVYLFKGKNV